MKQAFFHGNTMILLDHIFAFRGNPKQPKELCVIVPTCVEGQLIFAVEHYMKYADHIGNIDPPQFVYLKNEYEEDVYLHRDNIAMVFPNKENTSYSDILLATGVLLPSHSFPKHIIQQFVPQYPRGPKI